MLSRSAAVVRRLWLISLLWGVVVLAKPVVVPYEEHYRAARRLYDKKEYAAAAVEFLEAYELRRDPRLLLNAGNAYLMGGRLEEALRTYQRCQEHQPPLDAASQAALQEGYRAAQARLSRAEEERVAQAQKNPPVVAPAPPALPARTLATPPPPHPVPRPLWRSPWLWGSLSVVVAAGVVTGAVLATRPADPLATVPEANRFQLPF